MVDKRITELDAYTPPIDTDVLPIVDITTSTTKKITWANIKLAIGSPDGWIPTGAFTYNSATEITVAAGGLLIYQKGDKLKLTQARSQAFTNDIADGDNVVINMVDTSEFNVGNIVTVSSSAGSETAKITVVTANTSITVNTLGIDHSTTSRMVYIGRTTTGIKDFYIVDVADTLLTITGGISYTLENAAISSPFYSKIENPQGFLDILEWTPVYSASGSMTFTSVATYAADFKVSGRTCIITAFEAVGTTGGTANTILMATLPITPSTGIPTGRWSYNGAVVKDGGEALGGILRIEYPNLLSFNRYDGANWSLGTNRRIKGQLIYPI